MTALTAQERAAVAEAERQGRIMRVTSCPFWGGVGFARLFMGGDELAGESWKNRQFIQPSDFDQKKSTLRRIERDVAAGRIT